MPRVMDTLEAWHLKLVLLYHSDLRHIFALVMLAYMLLFTERGTQGVVHKGAGFLGPRPYAPDRQLQGLPLHTCPHVFHATDYLAVCQMAYSRIFLRSLRCSVRPPFGFGWLWYRS